MKSHFKFNSIGEVKKFDEYLKTYYSKNTPYPYHFDILNLEEWYSFCRKDETNGGRIFTCVFDIKLNLIQLEIEMSEVAILWGKFPKNQATINILDSQELFDISLGSLHNYWNFVLLYRALWDKVMGLIVLLTIPSKYVKYTGGTSRKKNFLKIMTEHPNTLTIRIHNLLAFIEDFDKRYRTSEAHKSGTLRKWVLSPSTITSFETVNPTMELQGGYWNELYGLLRTIDLITLSKTDPRFQDAN